MRLHPISLRLPLVSTLLLLNACAPTTAPEPELPTVEESDPTSTADAAIPDHTPRPRSAWQTYENSSFGLALEFPFDWYGPDVYEVDNQLRIAIGSDVVIPYGTQLDNSQVLAENSYHVVIQYVLNSDDRSLERYRETQPWFDDYLRLLELNDGESATDLRSLTTRVRALSVGRFTGAEFTSTLSDTAQTERFFSRTVFLHDEHLNVLLVTGSPSNVSVSDPAGWRLAFQSIDEANLDTLYHVVGSLQIK